MALSADIVARIAGQLAKHAGLELAAWVVEARASARIARLGVAPSAYVDLIASGRGAGELDELIEAVRVGETRLFRHRSQITALVEAVAPALEHKRAVRVWSAACSTGEEAYTLAIALDRALPGVEVSIVATDVSADALEVARDGRYAASALDHVPDEYRDGFVIDDTGAVCVHPELMARVRFERANLMDAAPGRDFDLVWCRNVLIYFTAEAKKRVIERIIGATAKGGFVFVGYSESLRDIDELDPVRAGDAVYYVRRARRSDTTPAMAAVAPPGSGSGSGSGSSSGRSAPTGQTGKFAIVGAGSVDLTIDDVEIVEDVVALRGHPDPDDVAAELATRLGAHNLAMLAIDLDGADLLDDALAPVLRRFAAAGRAAGVEIRLVATRAGARRWVSRHQLGEDHL